MRVRGGSEGAAWAEREGVIPRGGYAPARFRGPDDSGVAARPGGHGGITLSTGPPRRVRSGRRVSARQGLLRPDRLAPVGLAAAPALGELGHQEQAAAALVEGVGAAQMG